MWSIIVHFVVNYLGAATDRGPEGMDVSVINDFATQIRKDFWGVKIKYGGDKKITLTELFFWLHCRYIESPLFMSIRGKTFWPRRSQCGNRLAQTPTSCLRGPCSWPSRWALLPSGAQAPYIPPKPTWSSQILFLGPSLFLCPQSWLSSWAVAWDTQRCVQKMISILFSYFSVVNNAGRLCCKLELELPDFLSTTVK